MNLLSNRRTKSEVHHPRFGVIFLFLFLFLNPLRSGLALEPAKNLFQKAQSLFDQGLRQEGEEKRLTMLRAAHIFLSLQKERGIENGYLFYNAGNAYYEAGERAKALLYYRRAQRYLPAFGDLQANLAQVQSDLNLSEGAKAWWDGLLKEAVFWHYLIDYGTREKLGILFFSLFWAFFAIGIFYRSIFLVVGQWLVMFVALNLGISCLVTNYQVHWKKTGVVLRADDTGRKGPSESYQPFFSQPIPAGMEFQLLEERSGWWKIALPSGEELWLKRESAEQI